MISSSAVAKFLVLGAVVGLAGCVADGAGPATTPQAFVETGGADPASVDMAAALLAPNPLAVAGLEPASETAAVTMPAAAPADAAPGSGLRFTPVIGVPLTAAMPLSQALVAEANELGVQLKSSSDLTSEHVMRGYLAAEPAGETVLVVYVWDVLDGTGNRLHRIRGVEEVAIDGEAPAAGEAAWAAVPAEVMTRIGERSLSDYQAWQTALSASS
jgi:hypothetical protein